MIIQCFWRALFLAAVFGCSSAAPVTPTPATETVKSDNDAMMYLQQFGYMAQTPKGTAPLVSADSMSNAIMDFQRFAGIEETGKLDNETMVLMNMPRCGVKDIVSRGHGNRKKRYALQGSKWRTTDLTYRIGKYPTRLKDRAAVEKEIARALKVWSTATNLRFTEKKSGRVHIEIRFEKRNHGDGDPFDGPGRTLAHAFFPQFGGDAHFDDEEKWSIGSRYGTNLLQVSAHEFGHSLGLSHSDVKSALMAPFYRGYDSDFRLGKDDIAGIRSLYGAPSSNTPNAPREEDLPPRNKPDYGDAPDLCHDSNIDAATRTQDGKSYVFKGIYYWRVETKGLADGYPRKIAEDWDGLPGNLDAVLTWSDGKTFFFKGSKYWRFHNQKMGAGYPKDIKVGFEGIPNDLDAAMVWSGNGKTYFFKGDMYWKYESRNTPPVSSKYPRPINQWEGIPNNLDATFQWENGKTFFFKGPNYYRFNDRTFSVDASNPPYPRSTAVWWFDCKPISGKEGLQGEDGSMVYVGETSSSLTAPENSADADKSILYRRSDFERNSGKRLLASYLTPLLVTCTVLVRSLL